MRGEHLTGEGADALPSRRQLLATWLAAAVGFGVLLAVARGFEGPLDDPDPAYQRPGFLDLGPLPEPAPEVRPGLPAPGRPAVVFFVRETGARELCRAVAGADLARHADVAVVVAGDAPVCDGLAVVSDAGRLARAFGLRQPDDGGAPVGYAMVDEQGRIRYRTLDPTVADELDEVATILEAAR